MDILDDMGVSKVSATTPLMSVRGDYKIIQRCELIDMWKRCMFWSSSVCL